MAFTATAADILEEEEFTRTCRHQFILCDCAELNGRSCNAEHLADDRTYGPAHFKKAQFVQLMIIRPAHAEEGFEEMAHLLVGEWVADTHLPKTPRLHRKKRSRTFSDSAGLWGASILQPPLSS